MVIDFLVYLRSSNYYTTESNRDPFSLSLDLNITIQMKNISQPLFRNERTGLEGGPMMAIPSQNSIRTGVV